VDNAVNNDTMLKELSILLKDRNIKLDPVDRKVMCYGHVVDLASGHVIDGVTSTNADEWDELPELVSVEDDEDDNDNDEPNTHDPIALARSVV
jgi:hypothetical protein